MDWLRNRRELLRWAQEQVHLRLGDQRSTQAYQAQYEAEFQRKWSLIHRSTFLRHLDQQRLLLLADFHALQQSQKTHLRILKGLKSDRPQVLMVEFFETQHQKLIDKWMAGTITEKEFLRQIQWQKRWGFPWENYRPLVRWAQKKKIPVIGLNLWSEKRSVHSLRVRDRHFAQQIAQITQAFPESQWIAVIGDWHLARGHLPHELKKKRLRHVPHIVFQNSERIYFQLLKKNLEMTADIVRLSENSFCISNVPPWVKWQNYLFYLEKNYDLSLDEDSAIELTDHVENHYKILCQDFQIKPKSGHFSVYTRHEHSFFEKLKKHYSSTELKQLRFLIKEGESFYLPEIQAGYLSRGSVNQSARLASSILHFELADIQKTPLHFPEDYIRNIWIQSLQYFGNKMINPKKKSPTLLDIKNELLVDRPTEIKAAALKLTLSQRMQEIIFLSSSRKPQTKAVVRQNLAYLLSAKLIGTSMGEKLYFGYRKKLIQLETIRKLYRKNIYDPSFLDFYYEMVEFVEGLPQPFVSKSDKL